MVSPLLVADDHPLFRAALVKAISDAAPGREVIERETLGDALDVLAAQPVGLLSLDLHMPDSEGLAGLLQVRSLYPAVPVVVVSGDTAPGLAGRAASLGASGFVPKSSDLPVIREAMETVLEGDTWLPEHVEESSDDTALKSLTPAQLKVLLFVRDGLLNKQIAYEMQISEATVKAHMTAVMQKLSVQTRTQAAMLAQRLNVTPTEHSAD
ncbi:MAG: response regulator transcription factor [Pseudomonadota bacterium]